MTAVGTLVRVVNGSSMNPVQIDVDLEDGLVKKMDLWLPDED